MTIEFRELRTAAELVPMPELEARVWGAGALVAVHMLVATIGEGGMAIGAFDGEQLVGSVYAFSTSEPHVLHSHYLAVDPDYRGHGLALELKHRQRDWCLASGRTVVRWTFDPLQLGNAHLNLRSLQAVATAYRVDLYGPMGGINGALPSDRLVVEWDLVHPRRSYSESMEVCVPRVTTEDIAAASAAALQARIEVRQAIAPLLTAGWHVTDVDRQARVYTLSR